MRNQSIINENEVMLLASLIDNSENITQSMGKIKADDFQKESHKRIYKTILELYSTSNSTDCNTIKAKLKKQEDRLNVELIQRKIIHDTSNIEVLINSVRDESQLSRIIRSAKKMIDEASREDAVADIVLNIAEQEVVDLAEHYSTSDLCDSETAVMEFEQYIENIKNKTGDIRPVYTGLDRLDNLLNGFQPGELIIVEGITGHGKSLFALQIALHNMLNNNLGCLMFSMEMDKLVLMARVFAHISDIGMEKIKAPNNMSSEDLDHFKKTMERVKKLPITISDRPMISIHEIQSLSKKVKIQKKNLGLIIVDYIGLIRGDARGTREQEVASITRGLKCLAGSLKIPVIALSQVNRNFSRRQDNSIQLGDARDSGAVENDSDAVIVVSMDNGGDKNANVKEARIEIIKQRNGPLGAIDLVQVGNKQKFVDEPITNYY